MRFILYLIITFFIVSYNAIAQTESIRVFSKKGNIYYTQGYKITTQLTFKGKDHFPILSPNHNLIAFVRVGDKKLPLSCSFSANTINGYGEQIWTINLKTKQERLLVTSHFFCDSPTKMIVNPRNLTFSPDGKILYFLTSAWTTSGAIHTVNSDGSNLHYLLPANALDIVMHGKYKGYLILQQHRYYHTKLGSYDWYWLFSPTGKEIRSLSDEQRNHALK
ncbi:MAG: hypothetical protein Q8R24_04065 [Legionellaceae bacterium]|nr:hypothetical protein [Legionellaceae bacterium]